MEPLRFPEEPENPDYLDNPDNPEEPEDLDPDAGKSQQQVLDELTGQQFLFSDEDF